MVAPADVEAAVRRPQRRDVDAARLRAAAPRRRPSRAAASSRRPAPARRRRGRATCLAAAARAKRSAAGRRPKPVQRWRMWSRTPRLAQPVQPGAQQRRRLQVGREDPARAADEGLDAEAVRPSARSASGPKSRSIGSQRARRARRSASTKRVERLAVGQVQPALAGEQELAADRGHGVVHVDRGAGGEQRLGGHQAGRAAADDGDAGRRRTGGRRAARATGTSDGIAAVVAAVAVRGGRRRTAAGVGGGDGLAAAVLVAVERGGRGPGDAAGSGETGRIVRAGAAHRAAASARSSWKPMRGKCTRTRPARGSVRSSVIESPSRPASSPSIASVA